MQVTNPSEPSGATASDSSEKQPNSNGETAGPGPETGEENKDSIVTVIQKSPVPTDDGEEGLDTVLVTPHVDSGPDSSLFGVGEHKVNNFDFLSTLIFFYKKSQNFDFKYSK